MTHRALDTERGSIPLALLAIIVVGAVASVLIATMVSGERHTRFDQSDEQALQLADVAMERMAAQIGSREVMTTFSLPVTAGSSGTATRSGNGWVLQATGAAQDGTTRTLEAKIAPISVFSVAAFGSIGVDYNGANKVDSYASGIWSEVSGVRTFAAADYTSYLDGSNTIIAPTHHGYVGTNGELLLKGTAINDIDAAIIHNAQEHVADPLPGATGRCAGVPTTCNARREACVEGVRPCLLYRREPVEMPVVNLPSSPVGGFDGRNGTIPAGVSVFTSAYLDSTTVIEGTPANPSIVYLTGQLSIPNNAEVNFTTGGSPNRPRPSPGLRIYSTSEGTALDVGSQVQLSAAIYAPRGAFSGGAQSHVWGSLIVNHIDNTGGVEFHYDESLVFTDDVSSLVLREWVETVPGP